MVDPYDGAGGGDAQDIAEVFDEDNTNIESMRQGRQEDAEQFEDLVEVYDATRADGDDADDDDDGYEADDLDDDELRNETFDEDADDDWDSGDRETSPEDDLPDDDEIDGLEAADSNEVELEYAGDLTNVVDASSSAADMEADALSDDDLRELDYKEDES